MASYPPNHSRAQTDISNNVTMPELDIEKNRLADSVDAERLRTMAKDSIAISPVKNIVSLSKKVAAIKPKEIRKEYTYLARINGELSPISGIEYKSYIIFNIDSLMGIKSTNTIILDDCKCRDTIVYIEQPKKKKSIFNFLKRNKYEKSIPKD